MTLIKRFAGTLKFCSGKHQFVKVSVCDCLDKCKMDLEPFIVSSPKRKAMVHCAFDNKLIDCKHCDTICDADKSALMFYFNSKIH